MATYSLLQVSLDQTIGRESLEEASVALPSVARADCAHLQRDLFGIVVSNLPLEEAKAFQAELERRGFPTDLVADHELPVLHDPFTIQRIGIKDQTLQLTDAMGRQQTRTLEDLVFVAGGFLNKSTTKSTPGPEVGMFSPRPNSSPHSLPRPERRYFQEDVRVFRIDLFFWSSPNRLGASVSAESTTFFQGRPLRLRDTALLLGAMMDLRELLPPERIGAGLRRSDTETFYPSLRSYEEEIRWHFHRLASRVRSSSCLPVARGSAYGGSGAPTSLD